jgi:CHAD domain-containing protein
MAATSRSKGAQGPKSTGPTAVAEIERKFDVDAGFRLPDLTGLPGVARVAPPQEQGLDATYFDTADLRLAGNRITLRRRTGGEDAGWHLKRPSGGERSELHAPLGRSTRTVPAVLRTPVEVVLRGAALGPVVRLQTTRTVHRLVDDAGQVLAEVAQDDVTASAPASGRKAAASSQHWQEVEVELIGGDRDLLAAVVERIQDAGARPSPSPSKLSRALGDRGLPRPVPPEPGTVEGVTEGSAGAVLLAHLTQQVRRLQDQDPLVRADQDDAVHQMRVATRRLRSALATYRPLLDRTVTDPIRDELQWLGTALGGPRDAEVIRDHLRGMIEAEPPELVLGPVVERIVTSMDARYRAAHDEALVDLGQQRYFDLLDTLDELVTRPPLTEAAHRDPDDVLLALAAGSYRRIRKLVRQSRRTDDPAEHDVLLHEVRKAAKRARYAGESMAATYGQHAKAWAAAMEAIQEALGEHQDSVVIRAELLELARQAQLAGEPSFSYGRLHAMEQNRAADTETRFEHAWRDASRKKLHRWLS